MTVDASPRSPRLTRRAFFSGAAAGAVAAGAVGLRAPRALADGPAAHDPATQHPATHAPAAHGPALQGAGFYRFSFGTKTVTVLADGSDDFPGAEVFAINATPERFAEVQTQLLEPTDRVNFHMNTLLVEEGERKILLDAGFGHFLGPRFGRQALALKNAGVDPAEIDTVVITHGHADHFAGLLDPELNVRFPNARIVWNSAEWAYWTSEQAVADVRGSVLPDAFKDLFIATTQTVLPRVAAQVERLDVSADLEIAPGVALLPAPGHTPHSIVVLIESEGRQLLHASDTTLLVQQNAIAPDWVAAFEYDGAGLVATRKRLLDRAAADEILWFGYHAPFPATGRIRRAGPAFEFVPSSWRWS